MFVVGGLVLSIMDQALWETATRDQLPATDQPQGYLTLLV